MNRKAFALLFSGLLLVTSVSAEVVPGRWNKVQGENPGTEMIITLTAGDQIRGVYQDIGADELFVTVNGAPRALPKSGIAKVTTAERRTGPLANGAAIGAMIGGIIATIAVATYQNREASTWVAVPVYAALGAGIGVGIDAAVQSRITLYKAPGVD